MRTISKALLDKLYSDAIESAFVPLLDLELNDLGSTHLRFASYGSNVVYGGETYSAWQFGFGAMATTKGATVPAHPLLLDDSARTLRTHAIATNWFRGATATIAVVSVDSLAADYTWSTISYDVVHAEADGEVMALTLGGPNPLKIRYPAYRYWAHQCPYAGEFPDNPLCGYSGVLTSCSGTLADCVTRGMQTHWGGFLGLDADSSIIVVRR